MILVDTSVWIDLLAGRIRMRQQDVSRFAVCGPVVQEVLQGLRPGRASDAFREAFLAFRVLSDPVDLHLFLAAADIYRQGRRRGITLRASTDCLIAAIAIENSTPVWHRDRYFTAIARFTTLEISDFSSVRK